MHGARVTVIVHAEHTERDELEKTIKSVDNQRYNNVALVIVADKETAEYAAEFAGKPSIDMTEKEKTYFAGEFMRGRTLNGTPFSVLGYVGRMKVADAFNWAIKETTEFTEVYIPLMGGDELNPVAANTFVKTFEEDTYQIGAVWCDYTSNNIPIYQQSFDRTELISKYIHAPCHAVSAIALNTVGLYNPELDGAEVYDMWMRLSSRFVITHSPYRLINMGNDHRKINIESVNKSIYLAQQKVEQCQTV